MNKYTLASGETVVGTPNYCDPTITELRLPDGGWRILDRSEIVARERTERQARSLI